MENRFDCLVCNRTFNDASSAVGHVNKSHPDWKETDLYKAYMAKYADSNNKPSTEVVEALAEITEESIVEPEETKEAIVAAKETKEPAKVKKEEAPKEAKNTSKKRRRN